MATYDNNTTRNDPRVKTLRSFCRMYDGYPSEENLVILENGIRHLRDEQRRDAEAQVTQALDARGEVVKDGLFGNLE